MTNLTQAKKPTFKNNEHLYLAENLNYKIAENVRRKIIRLWLEGKSRKDIALICDVSEGTVSNVIADWKQTLGEGDADALRELGSNLRRSGIDGLLSALKGIGLL
jgi:DNA-directed RNA polymerase specialized sigma24 family protein